VTDENESGPVARLAQWLRDPVRRITVIVLGVAVLVFLWYVVAVLSSYAAISHT